MINYIKTPFLTEKTSKKIDTIKENIANGRYLTKVCLITVASNEEDVFDIIPVVNFFFNSKVYDDITVIGVAENRKAAMKMCAKLSSEYVKLSQPIKMRDYINSLISVL